MRFILFVGMAIAAQCPVFGQNDSKLWKDAAGRSVQATFVGEVDGMVTLKLGSGRLKTVPFDQLSEQDRGRLRSPPEEQLVATQVQSKAFSKAALSPIETTTSRQVHYTVQKTIRECVPVEEFFGRRNQRRRIVYRWVYRTVCETRVETVSEQKHETSLFAFPGVAALREEVKLKAPRSAGAIFGNVLGVLGGALPQNAYPMQSVSDKQDFPLKRRSTAIAPDGAQYMVVISQAADPRVLSVEVAALTPAVQTRENALPLAKQMQSILRIALQAQ